MNHIEDVIQYIKEQRPNISPKKLRYALYLLYADYLTATEDGYDELFNHNFYTALRPHPVSITVPSQIDRISGLGESGINTTSIP